MTTMATAPDTAHLRCLVCYPRWIDGGTYAVCGHRFRPPHPTTDPGAPHCVICTAADIPHFRAHVFRGEIP